MLALGIAANMVVFTLVNGILLRDLPFDQPDRIVQLEVFNRDNTRNPISIASHLDTRDWNQMTRTFEGIAGADERTMNLSRRRAAGRALPRRVSCRRPRSA